MKKGLPKGFPERQRKELEALTELLVAVVKPVKVILFGSYARGDFVERDITVSDWGKAEVYQSDLDVLVLTDTDAEAESVKIWGEVERKMKKLRLRTPVSLLPEPLSHVNEQLELNRYFYADIQKEGRVLYEADAAELAKQKKLSEEEKRRMMLEDVENWMMKSDISYKNVVVSVKRAKTNGVSEMEQIGNLSEAAFLLHQVTEKLYVALWLAIKQYRPKTHDLVRLAEFVERQDEKLAVFDREDGEGKRLFELLRKAYVDARYKKSYRITSEELSELMKRVKRLRKQVERVKEGI